MLRSILIGLISGMRSMTDSSAMAAGELIGDKLPSALDRIIVPGIAARLVAGAVAGAALATRRQWKLAALAGAAAAVAASYLTFDLRLRALRRYGQTRSGLVDDALMLGATPE